jgi:hypothetical protein
MPQTEALNPRPFRPRDLGAMRNVLKILTEDQKKLRPKRLSSITGLGQTELASVTRKARPMLYKEELPLKLSSSFTKSIYSLVISTDLAYELFGENEDSTISWMMAPNTSLFGDSPFIVCLRGEGDKLIEWLNQRLGRIPGAAF